MKIFNEHNKRVPTVSRGVGLGFFDGVHRGHQELLKTLAFECQRQNLTSCVFTFPEHPEAILTPDAPFKSYLVSLEQRMRLLGECGIEETYLQAFNRDFAAIEPIEFLDRYLNQLLQARLLVVGEDYRFGHRGQGDVALLKSWAEQQGIRVVVIGEVSMHDARVSSSRIRKLISEGNTDLAQRLLGRPYSLEGEVVSGRKIGRTIGFPTANIEIPTLLECPAHGVYSTRTRVGEMTYPSITNIGTRPTVSNSDAMPVAETYIYDVQLDLYGKTIEVEFVHMIRPERRFDSLLQLGAQIKSDLKTVKAWHDQSEQCFERARISGIPVYVMNTERFASAQMSLVFQAPMAKPDSALRALLMRVLTASCQRYPSRIALASALDSLYGSSIDANLEKQGDMQIIYLTAEGLVRWTDGTSPFRQTCELLFDILLNPKVDENGLFDPGTVESERKNLISELTARQNDRSKYAYDRCVELFCGDQIQKLQSIGDVESLRAITPEDLKAAYAALLSQTAVSVYIGGRADPDLLALCFDGLRKMPAEDRPVYRSGTLPSPFDPVEPKGLVEHKTVEQTRLVLAYTGLCPYFSHQSAVVTVMNSMLGGDVHSLLFDVVREKLGLAYSVFSMNRRSLSSLFIIAGVDSDKADDALDAIRAQIELLASNDFPDDLMKRSKMMIESSVQAIGDDLSSMLSSQINGRLMGRQLEIDDARNLVQSVTREQVADMARRLKLVSCFALTGTDKRIALDRAGLDRQAVSSKEDHN